MSRVEKLFASLRRLIEASPGPEAGDDLPRADMVASVMAEPTAPARIELAAETPAVIEEAVSPPAAPSAELADAESPARAVVGLVLRLETEREPAPAFEVTRAGATVGRGPENSIRLEDLSVSRRHARITYRQGAYWLSDLGSMGGTWVDGIRLNAARRVVAGQVIDIGVCRLRVALAGEESGAPVSRRAAPPVHRRSG